MSKYLRLVPILLLVSLVVMCTASVFAPFPKEPTETAISSEPAILVATCIADRNHAKVGVRDDSTLEVIVFNGRNGVLSTFLIRESSGATRVEMRRSSFLKGIFVGWKACLRDPGEIQVLRTER